MSCHAFGGRGGIFDGNGRVRYDRAAWIRYNTSNLASLSLRPHDASKAEKDGCDLKQSGIHSGKNLLT